MKDKQIKLITSLVVAMCVLAISVIGYKETGKFDKNELGKAVNIVVDAIETYNITDEETRELSSTEIPELTETDEQTLEVQEVENEGFELQGDIAYEGDAKHWNLTTGDTPQLTYISQVDNRWKNYPYTSVNDQTQTIGSSGCGVCSAGMIIDSIVGYVDIPTLADVFVQNGYRSANNGTYWSAFRAVADEFNIGYTETADIQRALDLLRNNNYIVCSVGNGLFTSGGHYIVLIGVEGNYIKVYDPYLYNNKFETSTRRGKATVSGNTVYVTIDNFRAYANYKQFFCYSYNPNKVITNNTSTPRITPSNSTVVSTNYQVKVTANSGLNIRSGASTSYNRVGGYDKNTIVTILAESNGFGKTDKGWISLAYTTTNINSYIKNSTLANYSVGTYKVNCSKLNVRTGPSTKYRIKSLNELTRSARNQGGYVRGVRFTVTKVINNWGLSPSGYVCLDYCTKIK